jgi:hypothetical protein
MTLSGTVVVSPIALVVPDPLYAVAGEPATLQVRAKNKIK